MNWYGVHLSVCPTMANSSKPATVVCCCGQGGQEIIDRQLQQWWVNVGSAMLSAYVDSFTQILKCFVILTIAQ